MRPDVDAWQYRARQRIEPVGRGRQQAVTFWNDRGCLRLRRRRFVLAGVLAAAFLGSPDRRPRLLRRSSRIACLLADLRDSSSSAFQPVGKS